MPRLEEDIAQDLRTLAKEIVLVHDGVFAGLVVRDAGTNPTVVHITTQNPDKTVCNYLVARGTVKFRAPPAVPGAAKIVYPLGRSKFLTGCYAFLKNTPLEGNMGIFREHLIDHGKGGSRHFTLGENNTLNWSLKDTTKFPRHSVRLVRDQGTLFLACTTTQRNKPPTTERLAFGEKSYGILGAKVVFDYAFQLLLANKVLVQPQPQSQKVLSLHLSKADGSDDWHVSPGANSIAPLGLFPEDGPLTAEQRDYQEWLASIKADSERFQGSDGFLLGDEDLLSTGLSTLLQRPEAEAEVEANPYVFPLPPIDDDADPFQDVSTDPLDPEQLDLLTKLHPSPETVNPYEETPDSDNESELELQAVAPNESLYLPSVHSKSESESEDADEAETKYLQATTVGDDDLMAPPPTKQLYILSARCAGRYTRESRDKTISNLATDDEFYYVS